MNDQVNRAEAIASTEAQNTDAASVVPTPATENGVSGSTPCSFSAINVLEDKVSDRHRIQILRGDKNHEEIIQEVDIDERYKPLEGSGTAVWQRAFNWLLCLISENDPNFKFPDHHRIRIVPSGKSGSRYV